jgi:uncharacterized protein (UPF0335 family)
VHGAAAVRDGKQKPDQRTLTGCLPRFPARIDRAAPIGAISRSHVDLEVTMSGPVGVAGDQLRAFVERIEHVEEEIKALTEDKKDIYAEAKGNGFDAKILREVVRLRKQDQKERDEHESLLDLYLQAIANASALPKAA